MADITSKWGLSPFAAKAERWPTPFVFEELFLLAIGLKRLRGRRDELSCQPWEKTDLTDFTAALKWA